MLHRLKEKLLDFSKVMMSFSSCSLSPEKAQALKSSQTELVSSSKKTQASKALKRKQIKAENGRSMQHHGQVRGIQGPGGGHQGHGQGRTPR